MRAPNPSKWSDASRNPSRVHARFGSGHRSSATLESDDTRIFTGKWASRTKLLWMARSGPIHAKSGLEEAMKGDHKPADGEKQHRGTEGLIDNASVSCNEKGKEVENRARDPKRVPFEQPVDLRMTVHHYYHHHVVLTPGLCRSILSAFVLQLSMRFAWCELCVDVLRSARTVRLAP